MGAEGESSNDCVAANLSGERTVIISNDALRDLSYFIVGFEERFESYFFAEILICKT